jgi:hypothetical protein
MLNSEKNTEGLEEKGREEYPRRWGDRLRVCDEISLALGKPANIRGDLRKGWAKLSTPAHWFS